VDKELTDFGEPSGRPANAAADATCNAGGATKSKALKSFSKSGGAAAGGAGSTGRARPEFKVN
jgi:hypothetical protein